MRAALFSAPGSLLRIEEIADPLPLPGQVLLRVSACGVCRTDLHIVDGELAAPLHRRRSEGFDVVEIAVGIGVRYSRRRSEGSKRAD